MAAIVLLKLFTVMVSPAALVIVTDAGSVMPYVELGSPDTSNCAGKPAVLEVIVVPPVVVREPLASTLTVPGVELGPISPKAMPFWATILMVETILASTVVVVVVAALTVCWLQKNKALSMNTDNRVEVCGVSVNLLAERVVMEEL